MIEDEVAVSRTTAQRLCCDAAVVPLLEDLHGEPLSIGRRSRTIPAAIRRALNARDRGCRFPGCTHTRFLHGHHIQHWANEGETSLGNLVTLCSYHHLLVHEGGYAVTHMHDGAFTFFTPSGRQVDPAPGLPAGNTEALLRSNAVMAVDVSAATCDSKWDGAAADYDLILTAYFSGGTT